MSTETLLTELRDTARTSFAISGLVAIVIGAAILFWPNKTAMVVAAMIGVYAVIGGLFYIAVGLAAQSRTGWNRIVHILLGVLYFIAGIVMFTNLSASVAALEIIIGIMIGMVWVVQGAVALTTTQAGRSRGASIFFGIISILAGVVLLFAPALYIGVLWLLLGISLLILGVMQLVRAATLDKHLA